jgi:hypothetical protein
MKFQDGENKFRILSQPILGWEDWQDKKPIRYRMENKPQKSIDPKKPLKHFWAMIVWNYFAEEIQILQITQASIREAVESLTQLEEYGAPYFYDIKVMKAGENLDTKYNIIALPPKQLPPHIEELFRERRCNLEALFTGDDPFSKEHSYYTQGIFSQEDVGSQSLKNTISMEQAFDLDMVIQECDPKYREWFFNHLKSTYKTDKLVEIPEDIYAKVLNSAQKNMELYHARQSGEYGEKIANES